MAATFDAPSKNTPTTATTSSWTHVGGASPTLAYVTIAQRTPAQTITAVTYGGQACALVNTIALGGTDILYVYKLSNPPGGSQTVNYQLAAANAANVSGEAITLNGVSSIGDEVDGSGSAVTAWAYNIDCPPTGLVVDFVISSNTLLGVTGGDHTIKINQNFGSSEEHAIAVATGTGAGMTLGWTMSGVDNGVSMAFPLFAAGGSPRWFALANRWRDFLRDLRAGLMPPEILRRRYADLVAI